MAGQNLVALVHNHKEKIKARHDRARHRHVALRWGYDAMGADDVSTFSDLALSYRPLIGFAAASTDVRAFKVA